MTSWSTRSSSSAGRRSMTHATADCSTVLPCGAYPATNAHGVSLNGSIRATRSAELPTILTVAKETGMRRSEVVGIQRENLDLMHGVVHLPHTKNGRARDVPLTPLAREALRRWVTGKPMRGRIFTMQPGSSVTRAFIRARRRARQRYEGMCRHYGRRPSAAYFRDLRFHDLYATKARHSFPRCLKFMSWPR